MHPQLEAFVEVARLGSVTRAAGALYVTQPALTARLNALEKALGATLLVRRRAGVRLTEAGRAFLPYAERALAAVAEGREILAELERGSAGHVAIGASPAVSTYALPHILKRFAVSHPDVQVTVRTGHSEEVLELVKRSEVDLGLIRTLRDPEIEQFTLYEDALVLVVHPAHPFAERGEVHLAELAEQHFILFDRASSYHELATALFLEAGIVLRGTMELDNIDSAKKMVPQVSIVDEVRANALRVVRLLDRSPARRPIVAARARHAGEPLAATSAFLELLREMRPELQEAASATA
jgi:DNA-binding transcriptional LysR family regulator